MSLNRIFILPAWHCELNGPNRVSLSPLSGRVFREAAECAHEVECLALPSLSRILAEPDADLFAVLLGNTEQ
jgi:hypothetical protein